MNHATRDWSKAPKVPYTLTPERLAQITAEVNADNKARFFDLLNLSSARHGDRGNVQAASYPPGIRPGEMRARDGNVEESAIIADWAALDLDDYTTTKAFAAERSDEA